MGFCTLTPGETNVCYELLKQSNNVIDFSNAKNLTTQEVATLFRSNMINTKDFVSESELEFNIVANLKSISKCVDLENNDYVICRQVPTLFFYLPGACVKDIVATYLRNYAGVIASGLVTINMMLMTLNCASLGTGWLIFRFVDLIVQRFVPSLITSCSMVYNCFKYNAPIYCNIKLWTVSARYSLTKI